MVLGWVDMESLRIMDLLGVVPSVDPFASDSSENNFDVTEFVTSQEGIEYISDELQRFNQVHGTHLEWYSFEDVFILSWAGIENTIIGKLDHVEMIYHTEIDPEILIDQWNAFEKLRSRLEIICPKPRIQSLVDLSNWYYGQVESDTD